MPNRIIREGILTSERVNSLSPNAELFYRRLMSVVDDYGRFSANLTLLRASCYPLKLDSVKEDSIKKHLAECVDAGLVVLYTVADKAFLQMQDFRQQVRAKESKYPSPDAQIPDTCIADAKHMKSNAHLDVGVVEDDITTLSGKPDGAPKKQAEETPPAREAIEYLNQRTGARYRDVEANLRLVRARIAEGATLDEIKAVIDLKAQEWSGTDAAKYLRPETLFNATKYNQYAGQLGGMRQSAQPRRGLVL